PASAGFFFHAAPGLLYSRSIIGRDRKGRVLPADERDASEGALSRAHRRLMRRRLPRFAAIWLASAMVWSVALDLEGVIAPLGMLVAPLLHAGILLAALGL